MCRYCLSVDHQMEFEKLIRWCRQQSTGGAAAAGLCCVAGLSSTVQYRTVQCSTVQYSTVQCCRSPHHLPPRLLRVAGGQAVVGAVQQAALAGHHRHLPQGGLLELPLTLLADTVMNMNTLFGTLNAENFDYNLSQYRCLNWRLLLVCRGCWRARPGRSGCGRAWCGAPWSATCCWPTSSASAATPRASPSASPTCASSSRPASCGPTRPGGSARRRARRCTGAGQLQAV